MDTFYGPLSVRINGFDSLSRFTDTSLLRTVCFIPEERKIVAKCRGSWVVGQGSWVWVWVNVVGKKSIDLLQVDPSASGASLFWPRRGRRGATKSREVDLSRLKGCHLHFAPKMGSGVTRIWGFRFHLRVFDFNGGMC